MRPEMQTLIEWHSPDQTWVAVFLRDDKPWFIEGALVGFGGTPGMAVDDLIEIAQHLVLEGENFLTDGQIPLEHRQWLFSILDFGAQTDMLDAMYRAIRDAERAAGPDLRAIE